MINEAHPAYHSWLILDTELAKRGFRGWSLVVPPSLTAAVALCSLVPAFRRMHGAQAAEVNVIVDRPCASACELYAGHLTQTIVHPGLDDALLDALALYGRFRPGTPFLADPERHGDGRLALFRGHAGIEALDLWRYVLHLPWSAEPVAPAVPAERVREATEAFRGLGLPAGDTVVLLPHGDGTGAAGQGWVELARRLRTAGRAVCAIVPETAAALPGVPSVAVPAAGVIPFCDAAGEAIAARSGLSDLLIHGRCRRTIVHDSVADLHAHAMVPPSGRAEPELLVLPPGLDPAAYAAAILEPAAVRPAAVAAD